METLDLLGEKLRKKRSASSYSFEKNRIKAEFLLMCRKYLSSPDEVLAFSLSSQSSLSTFLDVIDDEDLKTSYIITQAENNIFHVEMRSLEIL